MSSLVGVENPEEKREESPKEEEPRGYPAILQNMIDITEGVDGNQELQAIWGRMGYWAPEIFDQAFWVGGYGARGIVKICKDHFRGHEGIHTLYQELHAYFIHKKNLT